MPKRNKMKNIKNKTSLVGTISFILGALFVSFILTSIKPTTIDLSPQNYFSESEIYKLNLNNLDVGILNGKSMLPTIPENSKVLFIETKNISVGDIVILDDSFGTTHRVYKIKEINGEKCYSTWGDNNKLDDGKCFLEENILGRVVGVLY